MLDRHRISHTFSAFLLYVHRFSILPLLLLFPLPRRALSNHRDNLADLVPWGDEGRPGDPMRFRSAAYFFAWFRIVLWPTPNGLPMSANGTGKFWSLRRIWQVE
jgi:hypothetical protein